MSNHDGHRDRMRKRFLEQGLDGFEDYQVLEMMLFYCIPRRDTNELAHDLINTFGTFHAVLDAPVSELCKVKGVSDNTATMLSLAGSMVRYYMVNKVKQDVKILATINECVEFLKPYFTGRRNEVIYILCLDSKCKVLACKMLGEGSVNTAAVPLRRIVDFAMSTNATSVVLAHNHPGGVAIPSSDDVNTTKQLSSVLRSVDILLADHIVFSDEDCVSMAQSGLYDSKMQFTLI